MKTKTAVELVTYQYRFSHNKEPRGYGRWAFKIDNDSDLFFFTGLYGAAKKAVMGYAEEHAKYSNKWLIVIELMP